VFAQAKRNTKAMIAFEKALLWQELFEMAILDNMDDEDVVSMAYRISGEFSFRWLVETSIPSQRN